MNRADVVRALRCIATVPNENQSCEGCKYRILEPVDKRFKIQTDVIIDGKEFWESCDCEAVANDAADLIEKLAEEERLKANVRIEESLDGLLEDIKPCYSCSDYPKECNHLEFFPASCRDEVNYSWADILTAVERRKEKDIHGYNPWQE